MKFWKKAAAAAALALSFAALPAPQVSAEWREDLTGWWYQTPEGYAREEWKRIDGQWYYFDEAGYCKTNSWQKQGLYWYYLKANGAMATGWQKVGEDWYYFHPRRGHPNWPEGRMMFDYMVEDNGALYYLDKDGKMLANGILYSKLHDCGFIAGDDGKAEQVFPMGYIRFTLPEELEPEGTFENFARNFELFRIKGLEEVQFFVSVSLRDGADMALSDKEWRESRKEKSLCWLDERWVVDELTSPLFPAPRGLSLYSCQLVTHGVSRGAPPEPGFNEYVYLTDGVFEVKIGLNGPVELQKASQPVLRKFLRAVEIAPCPAVEAFFSGQ